MIQKDSVSFILYNARITLKNISLVRRPYFCRSDAPDAPEGAIQQIADRCDSISELPVQTTPSALVA